GLRRGGYRRAEGRGAAGALLPRGGGRVGGGDEAAGGTERDEAAARDGSGGGRVRQRRGAPAGGRTLPGAGASPAALGRQRGRRRGALERGVSGAERCAARQRLRLSAGAQSGAFRGGAGQRGNRALPAGGRV